MRMYLCIGACIHAETEDERNQLGLSSEQSGKVLRHQPGVLLVQEQNGDKSLNDVPYPVRVFDVEITKGMTTKDISQVLAKKNGHVVAELLKYFNETGD